MNNTVTVTVTADGTAGGIATRTATVIDQQHVRVYRDWRQTAHNLIVGAALLTATAGAAGHATQQHLTLARTLTVLAGVLVFALLFVHPAPGRALRRWIYDNPADNG